LFAYDCKDSAKIANFQIKNHILQKYPSTFG